MRTILLSGFAILAASALMPASAGTMPLNTAVSVDESGLTLVRDGCGRGFRFSNSRQSCVPIGGYGGGYGAGVVIGGGGGYRGGYRSGGGSSFRSGGGGGAPRVSGGAPRMGGGGGKSGGGQGFAGPPQNWKKPGTGIR